MPDGEAAAILVFGPGTTSRYGTPAALDCLGVTDDQLRGLTEPDPEWHLIREEAGSLEQGGLALLDAIARADRRESLLGVVPAAGARPRWVSVTAMPEQGRAGEPRRVRLTLSDVDPAAGQAAARRRDRIDRLYRMLNRAQTTIIRATGRDAMFEALGRIAGDSGLFSALWVFLDRPGDAGQTRALCHCRLEVRGCHEAGFPQRVGATARGGMRVFNDLALAGPDLPWSGEALAAGHRAFASLPMSARDRCLGQLTLLTGEADFFDAETLPLLRQLADNIAYAVAALEQDGPRRVHEQGLAESRREIRRLAEHLQTVREDERMLISRELHDELGQALTALKLDIAGIESRVRGGDPRCAQHLRRMRQLVDHATTELRRIIGAQRPRVLDELGLGPALQWLAGEFGERSGIACSPELHLGDAPLPEAVATTVFRCVQESLTNVIRHAAASAVTVSAVADRGILRLRVTDNGRGLPCNGGTGGKHFGLAGLQRRAEDLGGTLAIDSRPDRGTTVEITLPLPVAAPARVPAVPLQPGTLPRRERLA